MKDRIALGWGAVALFVHLVVANRYGFFRDELYFIVCGRHPAFGYADQPPLVPLLAAAAYAPGHQLWMVRLIPALLAGALVVVSVLFARFFGARAGAAHLTGLAVTTAPMFLGLHGTFNTTVFEPLAWTLIAFLFARAVRNDAPRHLLWAGVVAGVMFEAKYFGIVWIVSLAIAFAVTPPRKLFAYRELWLGALIAFAIAVPSVIWQAFNGWPFAGLVHAAGHKNVVMTPLEFLVSQVLDMNPLAAPVWIAGLIAPFVRRDLREARPFAIAFCLTVVLTFLGGGKDYYVAAAFPVAFALGTIAFERILAAPVRIAYASAILVVAAVLAPATLPILPPEDVRPYLTAIHFVPKSSERTSLGALPQYFADQFGWQELADTVAHVYYGLSPADRSKAYVLGGNYGEAAAIDLFDEGKGLPPTLSGHNQYGLWGPHGYDGSVLIDVNADVKDDLHDCKAATLATTFTAKYVMPYENNMGIVICRNLKMSMSKFWKAQKFLI